VAKQLLFAAMLLPFGLFAQGGVGINVAGNPADGSAVLDLSSTNRGMLTPRMTKAQRDAIAGPATGLLIYQIDEQPGFRFYDGLEWVYLRGNSSVPGRIDIAAGCAVSTAAPAGSGITGTYNCGNGTGTVNFGGLFDNPPVVNMSSSVVPVPPPAPDIYCIPQYAAPCNTFFTADPITGVRIYQGASATGPWGMPIMERATNGNVGTGCDAPGNGNYYEVPIGEATATLSGNLGACGPNWYRIEIRSGQEWPDGVQAWIDWNADGDFLDAEEHISNPPAIFGISQNTWVSSQPFQVPNFALNGSTVMRCKSIYMPTEGGNANNPCAGGTFGETEDYTLTIDCATTGPAPEIPSYCVVTDVTLTSFDFKCSLLSGAPISPPQVQFDLVPVD
jgi:hypothetical protein